MNRLVQNLKNGQGRARQLTKITFILVAVFTINALWLNVILAATSNHVVISEVQTGSANDASKEFIELYNPLSARQLLDGWTIEYCSASGTSWTKKATLAGYVAGHGYYLVSTSGYLTSDSSMSSGLASTGGHVRIKDTLGQIIDTVGWGTAGHAETKPIDAPVAGGSIERLPGRLSPVAGNGQDNDDNSLDFVLRDLAEPQNTASSLEDPVNLPAPEVEPVDTTPVEDVIITPPTYLAVQITEALPDPASPLSDAKDEFIELYNPNNQAINLKGYVLRSGSGFKNFYTIGDVSIDPGAYLSFYSVDTSLSLPNSGSAVEVLDPLGNILDVTDAYPSAKTGQAWADIDGVWKWTLDPTPNSANILSIVQADVKQAASIAVKKATSSTKKSSSKKSAAKKSAAKSSKTTTKKSKTKSSQTGILASTAAIAEPSPLAHWLLITAGCFTIMYAIYGFRHDLYNYYIKSYRNIGAWLHNRPAVPWRRNHRADQ